MSRLAELRRRLDALRPLPTGALRTLRETVDLEWTYHSNAIEGNTLSLKETKVVLEGITVGGKSVREHLEAINHAEAVRWLEEIVGGGEPLTERLLRELHGMVLRRIDDSIAGRYRTGNVLIAGAVHRPPDSLHVPAQMEEFFRQIAAHHAKGDAVELATWAHAELVRIHPFADGNGRSARLLMNLILMRNGWPPAIIRKEDRLRYYEALDKAHTTGDLHDFRSLVEERLIASLELYLSVLETGS
ncbi:Fic family protein [bacterium]|nr:Fic family protein [bacterium]